MASKQKNENSPQYQFNGRELAVIAVFGALALIFGPFAWRWSQTIPVESLAILGWVVVTITSVVILSGVVILGWWVLSQSTLRHLKQDDADELRKMATQMRMMAGVAERATRDKTLDILGQPVHQLTGNAVSTIPFVDVTAKEINMGG